MTKKIEYTCNCCGRAIIGNKLVGVTFSFDQPQRMKSEHPLKCDVHFCEACLTGLVEIVEYAKNREERTIAP